MFKKTKEDLIIYIEKIKTLHSQKKTTTEIGEILNCNHSSITYWIKKLKLEFNPRKKKYKKILTSIPIFLKTIQSRQDNNFFNNNYILQPKYKTKEEQIAFIKSKTRV